MQNSCAARLLSSSFGTVSMGQSMQTLDVPALDNLFIGTPCAMSPARTADASLLNLMTLEKYQHPFVYCHIHYFFVTFFTNLVRNIYHIAPVKHTEE